MSVLISGCKELKISVVDALACDILLDWARSVVRELPLDGVAHKTKESFDTVYSYGIITQIYTNYY